MQLGEDIANADLNYPLSLSYAVMTATSSMGVAFVSSPPTVMQGYAC